MIHCYFCKKPKIEFLLFTDNGEQQEICFDCVRTKLFTNRKVLTEEEKKALR